jgi:uncharacterized repeat protein (TIGR01451 family)
VTPVEFGVEIRMARRAAWIQTLHLAWLLLILGSAGPARSQQPTLLLSAVSPSGQMPPLLYVKLLGPKGMQLTFFDDAAQGKSFLAPCTIGIRPGYCARVAISGVPDYPNTAFFATLEARGSLFLGNSLRNADYPAALVFRSDDFARVRADANLKKVIVLERPDSAIPVATSPDEPFEILSPTSRDLLWAAAERGQPLLVMHMGGRQLTPEELVNPSGTVLLPGEKMLGPPAQAPCLPWHCFPVISPELIKVPDGGDVGLQAGFDRLGKLRGLDPSDTVAEYFDSRGRQRLAVSNRVALCIPRFIIIKNEMILASEVGAAGLGSLRSTNAYAAAKSVQPSLEYIQMVQLENVGTNLKPSGTVQTVGTAVSGRVNGLVVAGNVYAVKDIDAACLLGPEVPSGPLLIIKWPDRFCALVGDIVTFTLKYTNSGGQPITNVVVSDSLTGRLEYVAGTSKTDREAIFTTQPNEAGSQVLRWEITGTLQPHESGLITFQVRVR